MMSPIERTIIWRTQCPISDIFAPKLSWKNSHLGNIKRSVLNFWPNWSILICWVTFVNFYLIYQIISYMKTMPCIYSYMFLIYPNHALHENHAFVYSYMYLILNHELQQNHVVAYYYYLIYQIMNHFKTMSNKERRNK